MEDINKGILVFRLIKQIGGKIKSNFGSYFEEMNLTGPQGMLVGTLMHFGNMKISDLSEKLGLSNSTVSGIVDRLESQGVVERIRCSEDRRVVYVQVDEKYKEIAKAKFKGIEERFVQMIAKASPDETNQIIQGLETLKKVLEKK